MYVSVHRYPDSYETETFFSLKHYTHSVYSNITKTKTLQRWKYDSVPYRACVMHSKILPPLFWCNNLVNKIIPPRIRSSWPDKESPWGCWPCSIVLQALFSTTGTESNVLCSIASLHTQLEDLL